MNPGLEITTKGSQSPGVRINTTSPVSPGVLVETGGYWGRGLIVRTGGEEAEGAYIETSGPQSAGISAHTYGPNSAGLSAQTSNRDSVGVAAFSDGDNSAGMYAFTTGMSSDGVKVITMGKDSRGIAAYSNQSEGIVGKANSAAGVKGESTSKAGLWGVSTNDVGVYGDTISGTYGVFTHDKMYAGAGIDAPNVDVAEYMAATGDPAPGTVVVIGGGGKLEASVTAYDTRVAGIVSTAPGVSLGTKEGGNAGEALIAVAGRVPCRVDAAYGPIHPGDVLTTSPTPGHAMKAVPVNAGGVEIYRPSTVLGKAMGSLESGTGTIEVLVTLQ